MDLATYYSKHTQTQLINQLLQAAAKSRAASLNGTLHHSAALPPVYLYSKATLQFPLLHYLR